MAGTVVEGFRQARADIQQEKQFALTSQAQELAINQSKATMLAQQKFIEMSQGVGSGMAGGGKPGQPPDPFALAETQERLADIAFKSGQPEKGSEMLERASTMRNNASLMRQRDVEQRTKKAEFGLKLLQGLEPGDQKGFDEATAVFQMTWGEASPYAGMEFTPELKERLEGSLVSALDKAKIDTEKVKIGSIKALEAQRRSAVELNKEKEKTEQARQAKLTKEGADKPAPPQMVSAVKNLIASTYAMSIPELGVKSLAIAERAAILQKSGTGLSVQQAASRAYNEAVAGNEFVGTKMLRSARSPRVGSRQNPRPMPVPKSKSPADLEKWKKAVTAGQQDIWTANGALWKYDPTAEGGKGGFVEIK